MDIYTTAQVMEYDLFLPDEKNGIYLIVCPGLPYSIDKVSMRNFTDRGFTVLRIRYRGTYGIKGKFLNKSPSEDVQTIIKKVKHDKLNRYKKEDKFVVLGSSFGGSVALVTVKYPDVSAVISLCPVIDFSHHGDDGSERPLNTLPKYLEDQGNYSFSRTDFERLLSGDLIKPELSKNSQKPILIIQGEDDTEVNPKKVEQFYSELTTKKKKFILLKKKGHLSSSRLGKNEVSKIIFWLKQVQIL